MRPAPPTVDRRRLLTGAAAGAGLLLFPPLARGRPDALTNLRGGEILPDPDFSLLRDKDPYLIGIRPYRTKGVRLELVERPLASSTGTKRLIHNYGHGGAGVTLSWGCAQTVVDHAEIAFAQLAREGAPKSAAVLGTGVIGLTTATELRRRWPNIPITVYAKSLDLKTTVSWVAGGQFEPSGMHRLYKGKARRKELHELVRRSHQRIYELQTGGRRHDYGVAVRNNYSLDRRLDAFELGMPRDVIKAPRRGRLPFAHLNGPGREYKTFLMNPSILMPQLVKDLRRDRVQFAERTFTNEKDLAQVPESLIVNCTGLGSRELFDDDALVPQRGHNVLLKKTDDRQFYFFSGGCKNWVIAYIFCRQDDIVVGGTIQKGNDSLVHTDDDQRIFSQLLTNGRALFNGKVDACVKPTS
jgi:D-amino-acid oxidase